MKIPFLDLTAQYQSIRGEITAEIDKVIAANAFAGGAFVDRFEEAFARYCQCEHAVGVGSGTEALWMALLGCGIKPGDEVITTPSTFIATAEAISLCAATPVFIDIDEDSGNMDPNLLAAAITPKTRAVIPVHLYGQTADMGPILDIARRNNLIVVEDACQAHGAEHGEKRAGSMGDAGCFSFYPGKNLGAFGEAGAVVTSNAALAEKLRMFRDHGQRAKYFHAMIGWNARMDGVQGAVLSVKLNYLEKWTAARRKNASLYNAMLAGLEEVETPKEAEGNRHVYHIYAVRVDNRDRLMSFLAEQGVSCGIHYPTPVHLQEAYAFLGHKKGSFPRAEKHAETVLSLPMYPELSEPQICYVAETIRAFFRGKRQRLKTHLEKKAPGAEVCQPRISSDAGVA